MGWDEPRGLIEVTRAARLAASAMAAGAALGEAVLLAVDSTVGHLEVLAVGTTAVGLCAVLVLTLMRDRIPARELRRYQAAQPLAGADAEAANDPAARRRIIRNVRLLALAMAAWMTLIGLTSGGLMPPVLLLFAALATLGRTRRTEAWERRSGVTLWQRGAIAGRAELFRTPLDAPRTGP